MKNRCTKTIGVFFLVNLFFSSGVWSFGQNPAQDDVVLSTPFLESFDEESYVVKDSMLSERWVLCDSAGNRISWKKGASLFRIGKNKSDGYLEVRDSYFGVSYLRSNPLWIEEGKAYLSFFCQSKELLGTTETDSYLLYGKTDIPEQMDTLGCIEKYSENWEHKVFPFESDGGIYYFAFVSARTYVGYRIDALEISSGEFSPHPVLTVVNMELPPSGCGLDTVDINVKVGNMGTEDAEGFVFACMRNGMETRIFMPDTIKVGTVGKELVLNDVPLEKGKNRIGLGFPELMGIGKENMIFNHEPLYPPHRIRLDREEMYVAEGKAEFLGNGELYSNWIDNKFVSTCFYLEKDVEYGISFLFKGGGIIGGDRLLTVPFHVSVGNSASDYESWEKIWDSTFISLQYQPGEASFSVEEDGLYAFCFSEATMNTVDFYLKDIVIDKKGNMDSYDLGFLSDNSIKLPYSSCGLDHVEIGFRVCNYKSDLNGFSAWYSVNGKDTVEQFFYEKLSKGGMYDFLFSEIAELDTGMNNVTVGLEVYGDIDCKNNVQSMVRYNHQPKHVPHTIDMAKGEMGLSIGENAGEWHIGQLNTGEYFIDGSNELVGFSSVCFDLSSDKEYRIEFEYLGGGLFASGNAYYDNCYVKLVPVGESYENGKEIWRENEVLTYDWLEAESTFSVEENGLYSFVFGLDKSTRGGFSYKNIRVSEVLDYDIRMEFHSQIPSIVPVAQLGIPRKSFADIRNMGKVQSVPVSVKAELGDQTVGMVSTNVVSFTRQELSLNMGNLRVGDTGYVKVEASVIGHEAEDLNMDQSYRGSFVVTDSVMSYYDSDSIFGSSFFSNASIVVNGPSGFALPYFLVSDTLTSVSIGWGGIDSNIVLPNPQLRIYPCEPISGKVIGEPILQQDIKRGYSQGWAVYDIPDMILDGCFLIGVYQMDMQPLGLSFDLRKDGYHYIHYILLNDSVRRDDVLGFPAIRLNLGSAGEVLVKNDIAMESMENPYFHTGAFGSAETIAVVVKNNAPNRYEGIKVRCMVNGTELTPASVDIEPYLSSIAEFTADLSSPNTKYMLTAWVELEGDENPSNDTIRFELTTVGALDPYVMDFEYCEDFSIDVLQGGWKTIDIDKSPNYGWQFVSFPHAYESYGFMAFNPVKTQPSIVEDFGMYPYQGRRFGASFASTSGDAEDWLVSPKLKMPEKGAKVSFYVKSLSKDYGYDQYKLFVSATDDNILSFKQIGGLREAPDWEWQYVEQDWGEYDGQEIYVAIQRVQENGYGFVLMIDDIRISKPGASVQRTDISESLSLYPNPAKEKVRLMASLPMIRLQVYDLMGRMVLDRDLGTDCSEYEWNVSSWLPGLYFLNVQTPSGSGRLKLVVK